MIYPRCWNVTLLDLLVEDLEMCVERDHPTQAWVPLRLVHRPDGLPKPTVIFLHVTGVLMILLNTLFYALLTKNPSDDAYFDIVCNPC